MICKYCGRVYYDWSFHLAMEVECSKKYTQDYIKNLEKQEVMAMGCGKGGKKK